MSRNQGRKFNSPIEEEQPPRRTINGLPLPERRPLIDEEGYAATKHALRFRGDDWDIVLNTKRDELTSVFISEAAEATGEPKSNIQDIRFSVDQKNRLLVKFIVRHKAQTTASVIQDRLATYPYSSVMALYVQRTTKPRPQGYLKKEPANTSSLVLNRRPHICVSSHGHSVGDIGPNGPEFRDIKEDEEPIEVEPERKPVPVVIQF